MTDSAALKIITGATLIHPHGHQSEGSLLIEGNRIRAITTDPPASLLLNQDVEVFSGEGCYLTPGLIELHFNGALGCNLNQTQIGEVQNLLAQLPAYGITSVIMTLITAPLTDTLNAIHTLEEVIHHKTAHHARPLGIHLEGPFINPDFKGAHPRNDIRPIDVDELNVLLSPMTRMVTLAPERDPNGEAMALLKARNIRISIGHTNASYQDVLQAVERGATSVTHLYNAMRPFHHREPGIVGAALCEDRLFVQIIGDGAHVHPEAVRVLLRCKRPGQILLTSDASPAAGMPEGAQVSFAGQTVTVQKQEALNQAGALAGSSKLVTDCVRNLVQWRLTSFADAVQFATLNPATFLGEEHLGRLEAGCLADVVLWNKQTLAVEASFINGHPVYQRSAAASRS